jgi:hypothetical protein
LLIFREGIRAVQVFRPDGVLVGKGNLLYLDGALENYNAEWTIGAHTFSDEWELVQASDDERARVRAAGFRVERRPTDRHTTGTGGLR